VPKLAPAVAGVDAGADVEADADVDAELAGVVLPDPARLQPAAITRVAATAATVLIETLTGFLPFLFAQTSRLNDVPRLIFA
jgi:hypothetical protein